MTAIPTSRHDAVLLFPWFSSSFHSATFAPAPHHRSRRPSGTPARVSMRSGTARPGRKSADTLHLDVSGVQASSPVKVPHPRAERRSSLPSKIVLLGCPLPPVFLCALSGFSVLFFLFVLPPFCVMIMMPVFRYHRGL